MSDPSAPMPIDEAIELYCESRRDLAETTRRSHRYRLAHLRRWAEQHDTVETTADLDGRRLYEYREWRRDDGDLNVVSLHTQLSTLNVFLKWLVSVEAAPDGLPDKLIVPSLDGADRRHTSLSSERAADVLTYLARYEYASFGHVTMRLLWRTGMRVGGLHALDVRDVAARDKQLTVRHRPEGGTSLKNAMSGERTVALADRTVDVLDDWIDDRRPDVRDGAGRRPLLATPHGRACRATLRRTVYRWTQPCQIGDDCPHGTTEAECGVAGYTDEPSGCPSIRSPHDVRTGAITRFLADDVPPTAVEDRCDVSHEVLDDHYDVRPEDQKAEQRRRYFD